MQAPGFSTLSGLIFFTALGHPFFAFGGTSSLLRAFYARFLPPCPPPSCH